MLVLSKLQRFKTRPVPIAVFLKLSSISPRLSSELLSVSEYLLSGIHANSYAPFKLTPGWSCPGRIPWSPQTVRWGVPVFPMNSDHFNNGYNNLYSFLLFPLDDALVQSRSFQLMLNESVNELMEWWNALDGDCPVKDADAKRACLDSSPRILQSSCKVFHFASLIHIKLTAL